MITFKDFFSFRKNRFFWLNIIGMIVFFILAVWGTLMWLDVYTHHGESQEVPNVVDKSLSQADRILADSELEVIVSDSTYVPGLRAGIVLDQTPAAGSFVKKGRTIYLTISTNKVPLVKIPDLIDNSSYRQAEAKLRAMGFNLTAPEMVPGEEEWVYGIKYKGRNLQEGDKVPYEATLTLCIGDTNLRDSLAVDTLLQETPTGEGAKVDDDWF